MDFFQAIDNRLWRWHEDSYEAFARDITAYDFEPSLELDSDQKKKARLWSISS